MVDVGLTLAGQPAAYWAGDYTAANEANPIARPALTHGPMMFAGFGLLWWASLAAFITVVRPGMAVRMAILMAVAHAIGGAAWLARYGPWGWVAVVVYLAIAAEGSVWCWRQYRKTD